MSKLISEYCESIANERVGKVNITLELTRSEEELFDAFKEYVSQEVMEKATLTSQPKISVNDLIHKLVFNSIKSEKAFINNCEKYLTRTTTKEKTRLNGASKAEKSKGELTSGDHH